MTSIAREITLISGWEIERVVLQLKMLKKKMN